jgi:hypothetical protein
MTSRNDDLALANLEQDLPTTAEDVEALRRAREAGHTDMASFARAMSRLKVPREVLSNRPTHEGCEPFEL